MGTQRHVHSSCSTRESYPLSANPTLALVTEQPCTASSFTGSVLWDGWVEVGKRPHVPSSVQSQRCEAPYQREKKAEWGATAAQTARAGSLVLLRVGTPLLRSPAGAGGCWSEGSAQCCLVWRGPLGNLRPHFWGNFRTFTPCVKLFSCLFLQERQNRNKQ